MNQGMWVSCFLFDEAPGRKSEEVAKVLNSNDYAEDHSEWSEGSFSNDTETPRNANGARLE